MPRTRKPVAEQEQLRTAAQYAAQCQPRPPSKVGSRVPNARISVGEAAMGRLVARVEGCIADGHWPADPSLLVGLYCWAHVEVYGVPVVAEVRHYYVTAQQGAKRLLEQEFKGDMEEALRWMRWLWARELDHEEWRRANGRTGRRLTWRQVFIERFGLTELRVQDARVGGPK